MNLKEAYALVLIDSATVQNDGEIVTLSCEKEFVGTVTHALNLHGINYTSGFNGTGYDIHVKLEDAISIPGLATRAYPDSATIPVDVQYQVIEDWLVTALEGGSNYWYYLPFVSVLPMDNAGEPLAIQIAKACWYGDTAIDVYDIDDVQPNGKPLVGAAPIGHISRANLERGCKLYLTDDRGGMGDDFDADDADVWFQFVVMGEIVYG